MKKKNTPPVNVFKKKKLPPPVFTETNFLMFEKRIKSKRDNVTETNKVNLGKKRILKRDHAEIERKETKNLVSIIKFIWQENICWLY